MLSASDLDRALQTVYLLRTPLDQLPGPEVFRQAGQAMVEGLWGEWQRHGRPQLPVVLKPNVVWNEPAESGIVTHPAFMGGLARGLLDHGVPADQIIVAEGGGAETMMDTLDFFRVAGYVDELAPLGVALRDLNQDASVHLIDSSRPILRHLHVSKTVLQAGTLINVPKMKTHNMAVVTLCVKNMQGMLTPINYRHLCTAYPRWEDDDGLTLDARVVDALERFYHKLADLYMALRPDWHILEGIVGRDGTGFRRGSNIPMGLALAGQHPLAVDQVAAQLMGFEPRSVGLLRVAAERGLWDLGWDHIQVVTWQDGAWAPCPDWRSYRAEPAFRLLRRDDLVYKD